MGVGLLVSTMPGAVTPMCNECGVALCWDVEESEYKQEKDFWDAWKCEVCNGGRPLSLKAWRVKNGRSYR